MQISPSGQEQEQIDRFLRGVASGRRVFAISGEQGLARVPSRRMRGREVILLWSEEEMAQSWSAVLASNARIKDFYISEVLTSLLPALAEHQRHVGVNWSQQAIEPEFDPRQLAEKVRLATLDHFLTRTVIHGGLWTLGFPDGPCLLVSATRPDVLVLPCWSEERLAEARIAGPWSEAMVMRVSLEEFLSGQLGWLERQGYLVAPEHLEEPGSLELEAPDFKLRLAARRAGGF